MELTIPDPDIHFIQLVSTQPFPARAVCPGLLEKVVETTMEAAVPKKETGLLCKCSTLTFKPQQTWLYIILQ